MGQEPLPPERELAAKGIVDSALSVHRTLGPGLLEAVDEACLCQEFRERGLAFMTQCSLPLTYHGVRLDVGCVVI